MTFLQQTGISPGCRELHDDRRPKRLRALRVAVAASVLGWLVLAAVLSGSVPPRPALQDGAAQAPRAAEPVVAAAAPKELDGP